MIRVSTRWAGTAMLLLGAAAVLRFGVMTSARGADPCASPGTIKATSLIPGTVALGERLEELDADTLQWSEGEVANPALAKLPMQFQIARSYDAPSLYGAPLALATWTRLGSGRSDGAGAEGRVGPMQPEELRVRELVVDGVALPVHVAWDYTEAPRGPSRLVAWFYVFDNQPVRSPLRAQLRNALGLTALGPRPLTLVTISALSLEQTSGAVETAATEWLADAWRHVARACGPR